MVHIVFEEPGANVLEKALGLDETLQGEIQIIKDDFGVGPIEHIYEPEGFQARKQWWMNVLQYSPYEEQLAIVDDKMTVFQLQKRLREDAEETLWIWIGQNQHDVCGYYWLIGQLAEFEGRILVLFLNNLPFINADGGIFYPKYLSEIEPKEFRKAKKLARPVTLSEFELDPDEWKKLCAENGIVRILEGGKKIVSKEENYFDSEILSALGEKTQKLPRLLSNILSKMTVKASDVFIVWRIREMVEAGRLLCDGDWSKGWKDLVLKDTKGEMFVQLDEPEEN